MGGKGLMGLITGTGGNGNGAKVIGPDDAAKREQAAADQAARRLAIQERSRAGSASTLITRDSSAAFSNLRSDRKTLLGG